MKKLSKREAGQQKKLHEQLDFFGAKKKRFVSIYASKPRIRVKSKPKDVMLLIGALTRQPGLTQKESQQINRAHSTGGVVAFGLGVATAINAIRQSNRDMDALRLARLAQSRAQQQSIDYQRMQFELLRNQQMSATGIAAGSALGMVSQRIL